MQRNIKRDVLVFSCGAISFAQHRRNKKNRRIVLHRKHRGLQIRSPVQAKRIIFVIMVQLVRVYEDVLWELKVQVQGA